MTKALHLSDEWQCSEAYLHFTTRQVERKYGVGWVPRTCHLGFLEVGSIRLRARGRAVVNDVVAELNGDFRVEGSRQRLEAELENIALPLGAPISFCLVSGTVTTPVATGKVKMEGQLKVARFGLDTNDCDVVPDVASGDKIEARKGISAGAADCSKPLLVSATFQ